MNSQEQKSKRLLKNLDYNKILENTENIEENLNTEDKNNIQVTIQNTQKNHTNENQQSNIESFPALYSRQQILNNPATSTQIQVQPNQNTLNNNVINYNQVQPVPIQTTQLVGVRYVPMNGKIVNHQIGVMTTMERVETYKPYQMICPYCTMTGMTVPEISWNCG